MNNMRLPKELTKLSFFYPSMDKADAAMRLAEFMIDVDSDYDEERNYFFMYPNEALSSENKLVITIQFSLQGERQLSLLEFDAKHKTLIPINEDGSHQPRELFQFKAKRNPSQQDEPFKKQSETTSALEQRFTVWLSNGCEDESKQFIPVTRPKTGRKHQSETGAKTKSHQSNRQSHQRRSRHSAIVRGTGEGERAFPKPAPASHPKFIDDEPASMPGMFQDPGQPGNFIGQSSSGSDLPPPEFLFGKKMKK